MDGNLDSELGPNGGAETEIALDAGSGGRQSQRASAADRHVGMRIRERRVMMGLSQQQLARMIGVTYQQAHKYERGLNRISAGRLFEIGQVLGVPVAYFFEGLTAEVMPPEMSPRQRMCLELARNFSLINNEKHQEALSQMARALAAQSQAEAVGRKE
jgi:transcriptional regulator with XRE-family HTH domain